MPEKKYDIRKEAQYQKRNQISDKKSDIRKDIQYQYQRRHPI